MYQENKSKYFLSVRRNLSSRACLEKVCVCMCVCVCVCVCVSVCACACVCVCVCKVYCCVCGFACVVCDGVCERECVGACINNDTHYHMLAEKNKSVENWSVCKMNFTRSITLSTYGQCTYFVL